MEKNLVASNDSNSKKSLSCGVIMPIAEFDECSKEHWGEVYEIIKVGAKKGGSNAKLVSEAKHVGVIQKQIVKNLYSNDVVVCDVSGRNPNVMLELGIRLAFNKPVVIVKDDVTPYSFDTSPVQHLEYPRTLRHSQIEDFQGQLAEKIVSSFSGGAGQSFLDSFGDFKVAEIDIKQAPVDEILLEEIRSLRLEVSQFREERVLSASGPATQSRPRAVREPNRDFAYVIVDGHDKVYRGMDLVELVENLETVDPVTKIEIDEDGDVRAKFKTALSAKDRADAISYIEAALQKEGFTES